MENEQVTSEGAGNPTQKNFRLPLILAFTLALGMFLGQKLPHYDQHFSLSGSGSGNPLDEILKYVDAKYVDSVSTGTLRREAIEHLLSKLDPHSVYISPDELKAVEEEEKWRELFSALDKDRKGHLDAKKIKVLLECLGH